MTYALRTLSFLIVSILIFQSCDDRNTTIVQPDQIKQTIKLTSDELEATSRVIATFINDPAIKDELLTFATEQTDYEVYQPLRSVLQSDASGRTKSVFAERLQEAIATQQCADCRSSLPSDIEDILEGYVIYAPYLAENFSDTDEPITVTWWDGVDDSGETLGILSTDASGRTENSFIIVNDDYASSNATVVLAPEDGFEDPSPIGDPGSGVGGVQDDDDDPVTIRPPRNIDCDSLTDNDVLKLKMPQYRLHGNTRGWPTPNYLYFWTVVGEFSVAADGTVTPGAKVDQYWDKKKVSRWNAKNENWLNSDLSFIRSNWLKSQVSMRIIVAHTKPSEDVELEDEIEIEIDSAANVSVSQNLSASFEIKEDEADMMFNVEFDRCSTLATITTDEGFGLREGYQVYRFDKFSFYLVTEIR